MKTIYICEKCDGQFTDYDAALACERAHIAPIAYTGIEAKGYSETSVYPQTLIVDMTNGARGHYHIVDVAPPPEPEEIEQESNQEATDNA